MSLKSNLNTLLIVALIVIAAGRSMVAADDAPPLPGEVERLAVAGLAAKGASIQIDGQYHVTMVVVTGNCGNDELKLLLDLPALTRIQISSRQVTDEGFQHLLGLTNLTSMMITQSGISESGMTALRTALPNCRISSPFSPSTARGAPPAAGPGAAAGATRGTTTSGALPAGTRGSSSPMPFGGTFGPGGTFRLGPPAQTTSSLATHPGVQSELNLTAEQKEKISSVLDPAAFRRSRDEMVHALLTDNQRARMKQLELQEGGAQAIGRDEIAKELQLTDEQRTGVRKAIDDSNAKMPRSSADLSALAGQGRSLSQALADLQKQGDEQILAVLTDEQRAKWQELLGPKGPDVRSRVITTGPRGSFGDRGEK